TGSSLMGAGNLGTRMRMELPSIRGGDHETRRFCFFLAPYGLGCALFMGDFVSEQFRVRVRGRGNGFPHSWCHRNFSDRRRRGRRWGLGKILPPSGALPAAVFPAPEGIRGGQIVPSGGGGGRGAPPPHCAGFTGPPAPAGRCRPASKRTAGQHPIWARSRLSR